MSRTVIYIHTHIYTGIGTLAVATSTQLRCEAQMRTRRTHIWHTPTGSTYTRIRDFAVASLIDVRHSNAHLAREVGGWGRVPLSRNLMSPTPRRKWYLTTGRRFH